MDEQPVDANIPDVWPPVQKPVPAALRNANLNCVTGNCTEAPPSPSPAPPSRAPPPLLVPAPAPILAAPLQNVTAAPVPAATPLQVDAGPHSTQPGIEAPGSMALAAMAPAPGAPGPVPVFSAGGAYNPSKSSGSISGGAIGGIAGVQTLPTTLHAHHIQPSMLYGNFLNDALLHDRDIHKQSSKMVAPSPALPGKLTKLPFAATGGVVAAASMCAAFYVFVWRRRRRKLGRSDSKSSRKNGGSPSDGLPLALQPVYKQGSADSQEPFLGGPQRMLNLMPWGRSKPVKEVYVPSLVSEPQCMFGKGRSHHHNSDVIVFVC